MYAPTNIKESLLRVEVAALFIQPVSITNNWLYRNGYNIQLALWIQESHGMQVYQNYGIMGWMRPTDSASFKKFWAFKMRYSHHPPFKITISHDQMFLSPAPCPIFFPRQDISAIHPLVKFFDDLNPTYHWNTENVYCKIAKDKIFTKLTTSTPSTAHSLKDWFLASKMTFTIAHISDGST